MILNTARKSATAWRQATAGTPVAVDTGGNFANVVVDFGGKFARESTAPEVN